MRRRLTELELAWLGGAYALLPDYRDDGNGGWSQTAEVGGARYRVSLRSVRRVRIPFKPRGTYGHVFEASVYDADARRVYAGKAPGSLGVRGILRDAGLLRNPDDDVRAEIVRKELLLREERAALDSFSARALSILERKQT